MPILVPIIILFFTSLFIFLGSMGECDTRFSSKLRIFSCICFAIAIMLCILSHLQSKENKYDNCVRNYAISIKGANVSDVHEACKDLKNKIN
jgi:hypothetical protein